MEDWSKEDDDELDDAEFAQRDFDGETRADIRRYRSGAGLPADDATVAWFLAEYQAGRQDPGLWETAAELRASLRRQELISAGKSVAQAYVEAHGDDVARTWIAWSGGLPTHVVAFTRDVERHRAALAQLHPHPDVIEVVQRPREKAPRQRRSAAQRAAGRRDAAERTIPQVAVAWQLWSVDATGRELTLHYRTLAANGQPESRHEEESSAVRVTILELARGGKLLGETRHVTVLLAAPLAGRDVIDGSTNEGRPRKRG